MSVWHKSKGAVHRVFLHMAACALGVSGCVLCACGQTGDLYLPDDKPAKSERHRAQNDDAHADVVVGHYDRAG